MLCQKKGSAGNPRASFSERYTARASRAAEILLHVLDHTALHVRHLQVQRQLWEAERAG